MLSYTSSSSLLVRDRLGSDLLASRMKGEVFDMETLPLGGDDSDGSEDKDEHVSPSPKPKRRRKIAPASEPSPSPAPQEHSTVDSQTLPESYIINGQNGEFSYSRTR